MKKLLLVWQRVVDANKETCLRCGSTQEQLNLAAPILAQVLAPLGIELEIERKEIDQATFAAQPLLSNQIWIAGRPLESWLGATVASSPCCSVCGDAECRTLTLDQQIFETIPSALIIKAVLLAAAELVAPRSTSNCCG